MIIIIVMRRRRRRRRKRRSRRRMTITITRRSGRRRMIMMILIMMMMLMMTALKANTHGLSGGRICVMSVTCRDRSYSWKLQCQSVTVCGQRVTLTWPSP